MKNKPNAILILFFLIFISAGIFQAFADTAGNKSNKFKFMEGLSMPENNDPSKEPFLFDEDNNPFQSLSTDEKWLQLEQQLRQGQLLDNPLIQWLTGYASCKNSPNSLWARKKLQLIVESERIQDMRTQDSFRPLAPMQLLSDGDIHLFNQVDGIEWWVPKRALTRGIILTGIQGGGKTRQLIYLCSQFNKMGIPFLIIDPKQELKGWSDYLGAYYIDCSKIRLDLKPPSGLDYQEFLPALMPQLADVLGVIYGTEILQQAAQICIDLRERYIENTGNETEICLQDIYDAVPGVPGVSKGRRYGYREAVSTSLSRILTGSGELFKCRKGVNLSKLFDTNCIIGCRSITDEFAAKWLAVFLLYWLFESERYVPSSDKSKRAVIFDDASRYVSNQASNTNQPNTSGLTHILSRLRSSGNCAIFCTQVPHMADPGVLALSQTVLCVGGLHYGKDTKVLAEMMALSEQQQKDLTRLAPREVIGTCSVSRWRKPVHGYTVDVP
jgi:hypothetical protein